MKEHEGEPVTDRRCKTVMLRAERKDTVEVEGSGQFTVVQRTETYFGPKLLLWDEKSEGNYLLTSPGPASQLMFWEPIYTDDEEKYRNGWRQDGEVRAFIADTGEYSHCSICRNTIRTLQHERLAAFGVEHDEPPQKA